MSKTKLETRTKWIKRLKSYRNPDKRCKYPWQLGNLGYCWGYANWLDIKNKDKGILGEYSKFESYMELCKDCEYWNNGGNDNG